MAGVLQHVMVRGIEKRNIFLDDRDRTDFVKRLSQLLLKTRTDCLAWAESGGQSERDQASAEA